MTPNLSINRACPGKPGHAGYLQRWASQMHILITLIVALFFTQAARAEEDPNYAYSISFKEGMTMTRYAKPEFVEKLRTTRPEGVSIIWSYNADKDAVQSSSNQEIEAINEVVAKVLESHPSAVLALTSIRRSSQGIWAFYTSNGSSLSADLEANLKGKTQTPIRFRAGKDPEWKAFTNFLDRLQEEK